MQIAVIGLVDSFDTTSMSDSAKVLTTSTWDATLFISPIRRPLCMSDTYIGQLRKLYCISSRAMQHVRWLLSAPVGNVATQSRPRTATRAVCQYQLTHLHNDGFAGVMP